MELIFICDRYSDHDAISRYLNNWYLKIFFFFGRSDDGFILFESNDNNNDVLRALFDFIR